MDVIKLPLSTCSWQRCVMMSIVVFGHNLRIPCPPSPVFFILPFRQYVPGRIEHGSQKKKCKRDCHGVQMWNRTGCQYEYCCPKEYLPFIVKSGQPFVGTSEREQNGTERGRCQNAPFAEMPSCINIVVQKNQYEHATRVQFPCVLACGHS